MEKVGIIGLGWFGLPLAKSLSKNYKIAGTSTSLQKLEDLETERKKQEKENLKVKSN